MSSNLTPSQLPQVKILVLNKVRSYPGILTDRLAKEIGVPLMMVNTAVEQLKREGLLLNKPALYIGRKQG